MEKEISENGSRTSVNDQNILQKLLRIDPNLAKLTVFDMFVAAIDSTTATSQTLLYELAINPEKQAKLHEEIFKILPEIDSPLNADNIFNAPYLRACLKESLRMQPVVPVNLRSTGQDIVLNGYQVPKMVCFRFHIISDNTNYE